MPQLFRKEGEMRLLAAFVVLCAVAQVSARPVHPEPECWIPVEVTRVIDGDTVRGNIIMPFGNIVLRDVSIRAAGMDTWEVSKSRKSEPFKSFTEEQWQAEFRLGNKALREFKELLDGGRLYVSPIPEKDKLDPWRDVQARWKVYKGGIGYDVAEEAKRKGWVRK